MKDGFYAVNFRTPGDHGDGLLVIKGGVINGGDAYYLYRGVMSGSGGAWSGPLEVEQYKPGNKTVFGTTGNFVLDARITYNASNDTLSGTAAVRNGPPGAVLGFDARRIANVA